MSIPRRNQLDKITPEETAIYDCMQKVEDMEANPHLTDAVNHLIDARDSVAGFVDKVVYKGKETIKHGWIMELYDQKGNSTQLAVCFDKVTGCAGFTNIAHEDVIRFGRKRDAEAMILYLSRIALAHHRIEAIEHQWG